MKSVLLDTNVIMDAITAREPFRSDAERIFRMIVDKEITACLTATCVTDIFYLYSKKRTVTDTRQALWAILRNFSVLDVRGRDCIDAFERQIDDYEDALLVVCGIRAGVDCIVTRDNALLAISDPGIRILSPKSFLAEFN